MSASLAMIVQPLTNDGAGGHFGGETAIVGTLAALGALQDRDGVLLLHADATVAVAIALGGLDLRPAVPLEGSHPGPEGGARVVHVLLPPSPPGAGEAMYEASLHSGTPEEADDMIMAGLIEPVNLSFEAALEQFRPGLVLALVGPDPLPNVRQALDQAEHYGRRADCQLLIADPQGRSSAWQPVTQFLTPEQHELTTVPIPSEDEPIEGGDGGKGEGDTLLREIEREAMQVARLSVAVERAILHLLRELG
jgi:hypothetical protein